MSNSKQSRPKARGREDRDVVDSYLDEIAELPLLSQNEERELAKRIHQARRSFRRQMLGCDHVARGLATLLRKVQAKESPFTQYIRPTLGHSKKEIEERLAEKLQAMDAFLDANAHDYRKAVSDGFWAAYGLYQNGILCQADNVRIQTNQLGDSTVPSPGNGGLRIVSGTTADNTGKDVAIVNNTIYVPAGIPTPNKLRYGIFVRAFGNNSIQNNYIEGITDGVDPYHPATGIRVVPLVTGIDWAISGNNVQRLVPCSQAYGIYVYGPGSLLGWDSGQVEGANTFDPCIPQNQRVLYLAGITCAE